MDFNSRPCKKVDDGALCDDRSTDTISTHDLTRRSTHTSMSDLRMHAISTHDLTRKSTNSSLPCSSKMHISTHDLTRRSTHSSFAFYFFGAISTHDLARRSTSRWTDLEFVLQFQLTTSQGGRPLLMKLPALEHHFNSRPHKEVDNWFIHNVMSHLISTHDLTRRSTRTASSKPCAYPFQLTTSRGGRPSAI